MVCLGEADRSALAAKAAQRDAAAQDALGTQYLSSCEGNNDPERGMELLVQAAAHGSAHAQVQVADAYRTGHTVPKNKTAALTWYEKAVKLGDPRARNNLGMMYLQGDGVEKDLVRAARLFTAAADQHLVEACVNLASLYDQGLGVTQDYAAARKWYQLAAEGKDADAEYRLSLLFEQGLGGPNDQAGAADWLRRAAADGSEDAQVKLGLKSPSLITSVNSGYFQYQIAQALFEGKGVNQDQAKALTFLEKSAEAGYPPAFLALGRMYFRGDGIPKDEAKSVGYFEQAIAHDPKSAMAYNAFAWALVTASDPKVRNPAKALDYAKKAIETSGGTHSYEFDTLAHAYYGLDDFDNAIENEAKAVALEPSKGDYQQALLEFTSARDRAKPAK
ncbi:MAG TPA: hypothetical protein VF532_14040 [Candidatus Angelobacter sp.]